MVIDPTPPALMKEDTSLKELIVQIRIYFRFLLKKWKIILLCTILGGILGFAYSSTRQDDYLAECTFVLDENNSGPSAMGGLAAFGLGGSKSAGLFSGVDNIIWLYSSRTMLQNALLSEVVVKGEPKLLVNWFLEETDLRERYKKYPSIYAATFNAQSKNEDLTVSQNALLNGCITLIRQKYLKAAEVKLTSSIVSVSFKSSDELFAKMFTDKLVQTVNDYYIQTKTQKLNNEIAALSGKADTVRMQINESMSRTARSIDAIPFINPSHQALRVASQRQQVDVQANIAIYTEVVKNVEATKMTLAKEVPLLQVVDQPVLPLPNQRLPIEYGIVIGIALGMILISIMLIGYKAVTTLFFQKEP